MLRRFLIAVGTALALVNAGSAQTSAPEAPLPVVESPVVAAAPCLACEGGGAACRRFWATADYVLGWFEGTGLPPLVTTSLAGTPQPLAGVLGVPSTSILFGNDSVNRDPRSGLKLGAGYWFDDPRTLGVEIGFMILESQATLFSSASDGSIILARPFVNAVSGTPQAVLIAFPGASAGSVDVRAGSDNFYEAHFDLTEKIWDGSRLRISTLVGYRFYRHDDALQIRHSILPIGGNFLPGTRINTTDNFTTENEFHGLDLGGRFELFWDRLGLEVLTKLAVGKLRRDVNISGGQVTSIPGLAPVPLAGGAFALSSNSGTFRSDDWTLMPELGLTINWRVRDNVRLRLGYSVLILTDIARAVNQVDVTLNPGLFPPPLPNATGPRRPLFNLNREDVWLQTLTFGVEFSY